MNISLKIASRYLFSKKSHSAINIVSLISACGVAVGTMALVCVLSVYNGFQGVIEELFSNFDPQIRISASEGKRFNPDSVTKIISKEEVECYSFVVQENALLKFKDKQIPVTVKGVDENYDTLTNISSIMINGSFKLKEGNFRMAVTGGALANMIGCGVFYADPIMLYAPKREGKISTIRPDQSFREEMVFSSGSFLVRQEKYDNSLIIVSIDVARSLFDYENEVTSVDLRLKNGVNEKQFIKEAEAELGSSFAVLDRYRQQEDFYRMMSVEKWITYLILTFIIMIAAFNIIGSLSMLIIEKTDDAVTLGNLGMRQNDVRRIFIWEGSLISVIGVLAGIVLGLILCWLQAEFGLISMGSGGSYIVNAYPIDVRFTDILIIFITVSLLGIAASYISVKS
ncbi:MAG: FtsX-like permease family protein [Paludibacteraceae bacterium]|nr:FtsX-like permease family protein [Paludibacteraceae bacterium]